MSNYTQTYSQSIIRQLECTSSDMATIIGRYKGAMSVYADEIERLSKDEFQKDEYVKAKLEWLASRMRLTITENEQLWANRGKREVPTDIVELERA